MKATSKRGLHLASSTGIAVTLLVILSVPLGVQIPAIGNLLNPYGGIWSIDHGVPREMNIHMPFLSGEVTVVKDTYGVPHIYAEYEKDAVAVLGYMHAGDRLFQLEMTRRQFSGLLAEVAGPDALAMDIQNRNHRLKAAGDNLSRWIELNDPVFYQLLTNYTAGLNHYINTKTTHLPFEFHLIGTRPAPWTPGDVLAIEKLMSQMLTFSSSDLRRTMLNHTLASTYPTIMEELYPLYTPFQKPITLDNGSYPDERTITPYSTGASLENTIMLALEREAAAEAFAPFKSFPGIGSNNWVVDSTKSGTGAPILCNDMHLAWSLPMIWYEAHVVAEDSGLNVQGFTIPGAPIVIVGHNEDVAWGLTNAGLDHLDWYTYSGYNETHYEHKGQWLPYHVVTETIPVKGQAPVTIDIKHTVHGPVLSFGTTPWNDTTTPLAFRWVGIENVTMTFKALYGMNHASNLAEFNTALQDWHMPSQNIVYADRHGDIAIRCTGLVPIRQGVNSTHNNTKPLYVMDGTLDLHPWVGTIPFDELPYTENPPQGYLASANQLSTGPDYAHYLQHDMGDGYRGRRINDVLASSATLDVDDMRALHLDVHDKSAEWLVPEILRAWNDAEVFPEHEKTPILVAAMDVLTAWNQTGPQQYKMLAALAAPAIFFSIREHFLLGTFDEVLPARGMPFFQMPALNILENLTLNDPNSTWFNKVDTTETEVLDDILKEAIIDGVSYLAGLDAYQGLGVADWAYGEIHQVIFNHLAFLSPLGSGPYPADGSAITVNPSHTTLSRTVAQWGASQRMIIDFSRAEHGFDTSLIVIPGGSSGNPASVHYDDQLHLFLAGEYHPLYYHATAAAFAAGEKVATWYFKGGAW